MCCRLRVPLLFMCALIVLAGAKRHLYKIDTQWVCKALVGGDRMEIPGDGLHKVPLLAKMGTFFSLWRPDRHFQFTELYDDCNFCRASGSGMCTAMACPAHWWTRLEIGVRSAPPDFVPSPCPAALYFWWDDVEMRAHWRRSITSDAPDDTGEDAVPPRVLLNKD